MPDDTPVVPAAEPTPEAPVTPSASEPAPEAAPLNEPAAVLEGKEDSVEGK